MRSDRAKIDKLLKTNIKLIVANTGIGTAAAELPLLAIAITKNQTCLAAMPGA
jgi:hypothetical protein